LGSSATSKRAENTFETTFKSSEEFGSEWIFSPCRPLKSYGLEVAQKGLDARLPKF
jgi:hypothetical protein